MTNDLIPSCAVSDQLDALELTQALMQLGIRAQNILMKVPTSPQEAPESLFNPWAFQQAVQEATAKIFEHPDKFKDATERYLRDAAILWQNALEAGTHPDLTLPTVISPEPKDKRFRDDPWKKNPIFDFLKQNYLLWDRWVKDLTTGIPSLDPKTQHKIEFLFRHVRDSFAPGNFLWSNPKAIQKLIQTGGKSLLQGVENFLRDVESGRGRLDIKMVDYDAFTFGENIATTPGKVVYQNDLIQLIQYEPSTKEVFKIPVLLIPPCINKFYVFDLRRETSFVRWLLDQGFTVFIISWVNPDEKLSQKTFEDYVLEGLDEAVRVVLDITGENLTHALGFCIGGNILATYAGYKSYDKKTPLLASTTYLATLFDFSDSGDLSVFIDEAQLLDLEKKVCEKGYLEGQWLARTFNLLRANDLIWWFVENNYLLGEEPMAFDLLYWNSDSTNLPAQMIMYYLREMFLHNRLVKPNALAIRGRKIDLRKVQVPTFIYSSVDDHIAPWTSGYAATNLFKGPVKFILGGSGHIAGVFNHPSAHKYNHWVLDQHSENSQDWLRKAKDLKGSWWEAWANWLKSWSSEKTKARLPGSHKKYPPLEEAPGSYVKK